MRQAIIFYLAFLTIAFGCDNSKVARDGQRRTFEPHDPSMLAFTKTDSLSTYDQVPTIVKTYLDSMDNGKFLIANPNERWQAGCSAFAGEPRRQFIYAVTSEKYFQMKYWQGGIAKMQMTFTADLSGGKVISHQIN